ncbi:MAG: hypothetical protein HC898_07835 [Phycisphaerales bacterium]|nr:hypothetical protein [Phycisphaerales bacterium]
MVDDQTQSSMDVAKSGLQGNGGKRGLLMKCPACGKRMELDIGFAGSVCRCAHCGALVTVPGAPTPAQSPVIRQGDRPASPQQAPPQQSHGLATTHVDSNSKHNRSNNLDQLKALEPATDPEADEDTDPITAFAASRLHANRQIKAGRVDKATRILWIVIAIALVLGIFITFAVLEMMLG